MKKGNPIRCFGTSLLLLTMVAAFITKVSASNSHTVLKYQGTIADRNILYVSNRGGIPDIYMMDIDGSSKRRLTRTLQPRQMQGEYVGCSSPAWAPDATRIAYASTHGDSVGESGIFLMKPNRRDRQLLHMGNHFGSLDWSPNGKQIVYHQFPNGQMWFCDLYTIDVDNGLVTQITDFEGEELDPDWSPNGTRIVFTHRTIDSSLLNIYDIRTDSFNTIQTEDGNSLAGRSPRWAPDGLNIAFISDAFSTPKAPNICLYDCVSTEISVLTHFDIAFATCHALSWSPDGTRLAFQSSYQADFSDIMMQIHGHEIYVLDIQTGDIQRLTNNDVRDESPSWW